MISYKQRQSGLVVPQEPPSPSPPMKCWTAEVRHCDLTSCISAIRKGGRLLSLTASEALGNMFIRFGYIVVYESVEELSWEVLC